jgi:DNA-binding CsgD family transcriptional regulator
VIAEICNRLDGLPLAIELAARQIGVVTPQVVLSRLVEPLDLLSGGPPGAPARHQSVRAAIHRSYRLLDPTEQALFRRLAFLPGGFDRHTAEAVGTGFGLRRAAVWGLLTGLAGKSLCAADPAVPGRFRMLELVRAFGTECLDAAGERLTTRSRLMDWLTGHGRLVSAAVTDDASSELMSRISAEHDNLRHVVDAAEATGDGRYPALAILLAASWSRRGQICHAHDVLSHLLTGHTMDPAEYAEASRRLSVTAGRLGDTETATRRAEQSVALSRGLGDQPLLVRALTTLMYAYRVAGDAPAVVALADEQLRLLRTFGGSRELVDSINDTAWTLLVCGHPRAAQAAIDEALGMPGGDGHPALRCTAGAVALVAGDPPAAADHFTRALAVRSTDHGTTLSGCEGLAVVAASADEPERALRLLSATATLRTRLGVPADPWWTTRVQESGAAARRSLRPARAATVAATGAGLTLPATVEYARYRRLAAGGTSSSVSAASPRPIRDNRRTLTAREFQVAELVAHGHTNAQIAARLTLSDRTVGSHLSHIRAKLNVPSRIHIASWVADSSGDA